MSAISGILALDNYTSGEEWVSEYQDTILVRNSKGMNAGATLFGLMSKLAKEQAETTEYKWFERDPATREVYAAADVATTVTTLTLDDGSGNSVYGLVQVGTILKNPTTGEGVRVTDYTGGNYTIEREFFGTDPGGADSIADNERLVIVTLGKDEGANPAVAVYENPEVLWNYIQTFNATSELSNAFKGSKLRTDAEGPIKTRRVQALERIARDIEMSYFFGTRARKAGTNGYQYFTGGIVASIDTAVAGGAADLSLDGNAGSGVTLANFKAWLERFMTVGSDAKLAFCGPQSYSALSNFANSESNGFRITGSENIFGMNIQTILTPFGEINLAMHPLFKEVTEYNDWMVVCDLPLLVQKTMEPLFLETNIQSPGQDAYKEQFRAKYGLKMKFAEAFGYAFDLQQINAS